ncbi:MAG: guanylate kinase [Elusimicrobiota bacterium]
MKTGIPFVISAPSGAGKTTLVRLALRRIKGLVYSVTATTRPKSNNEKHSRDYFFLTRKKFLKKKKKKEFVETAVVHGYLYGTLKRQLETKLVNNDVLLAIDVQGALNVKKQYPDAVLIFIAPPSMKVLESRLRKRHRDSETEIQKRLRNARKEMGYRKFYDYIIVNDSLKNAFQQLKKIIKNEKT